MCPTRLAGVALCRLGGRGRFDMLAALMTLCELAGAMAYVHRRGVLHTGPLWLQCTYIA